MQDREVIDLLARILSGRVITDPINREIDNERARSSLNARASSGRRRSKRGGEQEKAKVKRKVSAYQREFGRQLKKLKKKHPRSKISGLMKKAHIATRKVRK